MFLVTMSKMAAKPIYKINPLKSFSLKQKKPMALGFGM